MKRIFAVILTVVLACAMALPALAENTTMVIGSQEFNGVFNHFFATTAYDIDISDYYVGAKAYETTRDNKLESGLCEYAEPEVVKDADGNVTEVIYTLKFKEGMVFSDGEPVTADDLMFTYKVMADPMFDGLQTLFSLPVPGMKEYHADSLDPDAALAAQEAEANAITDDEINAYIARIAPADVDGAGLADVRDYFVPEMGGEEAYLAKLTEMGIAEEGITPEQIAEVYIYVEQTNYFEDYKPGAIADKLATIQREAFEKKLETGVEVPDIEGIRKIDDMTVQVTLTEVNPTAMSRLANIVVMPEHYYGVDFKKGDLSTVKALNKAPLGAGPYTFVSFENNVVTLAANPLYYKGEPKIKTLKLQVVDQANRFDAVLLGEVDLADPDASPEMVADILEAGMYPALVDNNGYGYIGINSDLIPDINVRKALMHMLNRKPAVESYYGELATIIERPISRAMWAYPEEATEYYGYDLDKAKEYFATAGYELDADGKLSKDGVQFHLEAWLSSATHPVVPVFNQLKSDLEAMGASCDIVSTDWSVYNEAYRAGKIPMWAAAWGNADDPDMYQIYHSSQIESGNNPYHIRSEELDELILAGVRTLDIEERKAIYAKALDIVMEYACEMPFYQRMNLFMINPENINIDTLPENMTPFYDYKDSIYTLELQ